MTVMHSYTGNVRAKQIVKPTFTLSTGVRLANSPFELSGFTICLARTLPVLGMHDSHSRIDERTFRQLERARF